MSFILARLWAKLRRICPFEKFPCASILIGPSTLSKKRLLKLPAIPSWLRCTLPRFFQDSFVEKRNDFVLNYYYQL